jgi:hypothetical protein
VFDNSQWTSVAEYRVMSDQGTEPQYFDKEQEADTFAYNESLMRPGRWQLRSRTYGFEKEYTRGILQEFRPV